jgi:hypothetical protein
MSPISSVMPWPMDTTGLRYVWNLGDGTVSTQKNPLHTYRNSDNRTVCLEIKYQDDYSCKTCTTAYFEGALFTPYCHALGTYYSNYGKCNIDVIKTDRGDIFEVIKDIVSNEEIPDGSRIKFGYESPGDSSKCQGVSKRIVITCLEYLDECNLYGTVKDYTGLDGCGYIIELDNGEKLEPLMSSIPFKLRDNMRVKLSYKELSGMASICMVGKIVEILCMEEVYVDTLCSDIISLNTSTVLSGGYCNGYAAIAIRSSCLERSFVNTNGYSVLWSTGETSWAIENLCPNTLYAVTVKTPRQEIYNYAFSIFDIGYSIPGWTYRQFEKTYTFNLPVEDGYEVSWQFEDGNILRGKQVSYTFSETGEYSVLLSVKNGLGEQVYQELITLDLPTYLNSKEVSQSTLYPNPVGDILNIESPNANTIDYIEILDISGKIILRKDISAKNSTPIQINISSLTKGLYIIKLIGLRNSESLIFQKL